MKKKLKKSLNKDESLFRLIKRHNSNITIKKFIFKVRIYKKDYLKMIRNRFISTLLNFSNKQILNGINEINLKYKNELKFKDRLICLVLNK